MRLLRSDRSTHPAIAAPRDSKNQWGQQQPYPASVFPASCHGGQFHQFKLNRSLPRRAAGDGWTWSAVASRPADGSPADPSTATAGRWASTRVLAHYRRSARRLRYVVVCDDCLAELRPVARSSTSRRSDPTAVPRPAILDRGSASHRARGSEGSGRGRTYQGGASRLLRDVRSIARQIEVLRLITRRADG